MRALCTTLEACLHASGGGGDKVGEGRSDKPCAPPGRPVRKEVAGGVLPLPLISLTTLTTRPYPLLPQGPGAVTGGYFLQRVYLLPPPASPSLPP